MLLQVKDQEFPFNRDLARILVAVEDSNDNIPYFTSTVYDAVAYESSPVGTSVLQVTALDKDNGINGQLTYTMEAGVMLSESIVFVCLSFLLFLNCVLDCEWFLMLCLRRTNWNRKLSFYVFTGK